MEYGGTAETRISWWRQLWLPSGRNLAADLRRSRVLIDRSDALEGCAGGPEFEQGTLLLAFCSKRVPEAYPRECRFVRGANIAPLLYCGLEVTAGSSRVALCQAYPSVSESRTGPKRPALKPRRHPPELLGSRPRLHKIARRDLDLDLRLEERDATQVRVRRPLLRRNS